LALPGRKFRPLAPHFPFSVFARSWRAIKLLQLVRLDFVLLSLRSLFSLPFRPGSSTTSCPMGIEVVSEPTLLVPPPVGRQSSAGPHCSCQEKNFFLLQNVVPKLIGQFSHIAIEPVPFQLHSIGPHHCSRLSFLLCGRSPINFCHKSTILAERRSLFVRRLRQRPHSCANFRFTVSQCIELAAAHWSLIGVCPRQSQFLAARFE